jgi:GT2 family glycosyltransferase
MLSTIARTPLSLGRTLRSRTFDRLASLVTRAADGVRRVRYRRVDLRQMPPVEMVSDSTRPGEGSRWLPSVRVGVRSRAAFECRATSRVAYDVMLPPHASVLSWCTLAPEDEARVTGGVEFEIQLKAPGLESSDRCLITPAMSRFGRRWRPLRVDAVRAGPARIVLSTRMTGGAAAGTVRILWGDPRLEMPRSMADIVVAARLAVAQMGLRGLWHRAWPTSSDRLYRLWVRESEPSREVLQQQRKWSGGRARRFTLITFITAPNFWRPERLAGSLQDQSYPDWEWILVATDASREQVKALAGGGDDPRVRVLGVPADSTRADAWNAALRSARGEFAAMLGHHDTLSPAALYEMATFLERTPDCDLLYSDEDRVTRGNRRHEPHFKPDWSPDLLLSSNYIGRLTMVRVAAATAVGAFRNGFDNAEEWDLWLRLSRSRARVRRLPRCLYHRDDEGDASVAIPADSVLRAHYEALGLPVAVKKSAHASRLVWGVQGRPTVSIVIPNRNAPAVFGNCLSGLLERTDYPHRELVIVDNGSTDPEVLDLYRSLEKDGRGRIVRFDRPFNFSAACNAGAAETRGQLLLFLNNDIEIIEPDWLEELVRWAQLPHIGIVGAKLLYPDRTIQHAGVVFGLGLVGHIFSRAPEGVTGLFGSPECVRNYLAVTGACHMMRKEVFQRLGGYDERFRLSFSDVVLCMEAWRAGYRVVYTPHARLIHHESFTRKRDDSARDMELLARYLQDRGFVEDPYCHPELNSKSLVPSLRAPFDPVPRQVIRDFIERVLSSTDGAPLRGTGHANTDSDEVVAGDNVPGPSSAA